MPRVVIPDPRAVIPDPGPAHYGPANKLRDLNASVHEKGKRD